MDADTLRQRVGQMFANAGVQAKPTESGYRVFYDAAVADITIVDQQDRVLIHILAPVLFDVPNTAELAYWVAVEGQRMYFGSASLRPQDEGLAHVYVEHTLLGDYLDEDELHTAVGAVLRTADSWDDMLQQKFGGRRVSDL